MTDGGEHGGGSDPDLATASSESSGGILADTSGSLDETFSGQTNGRSSGGARRRFGGFLAFVLGIVGILASIVVGFLLLRAGFGATGVVDDLIEPVDGAIDRLEMRIDQADDAVVRSGVDPDGVEALGIRSESLVDMAVSANDIFDSVQDHPVYQYLPVDLSKVGTSLDDFETSATKVDDTVVGLGSGEAMADSDAQVVADEIDSMQTMISGVSESIDDASRSLRRWIRLGSFAGFLGALWSVWSQWCLTRRGLRGIRGNAP